MTINAININNIIREVTKLGDSRVLSSYINHFYHFPIFRTILNLVLSVSHHKRLEFRIQDKGIAERLDGLCETNLIGSQSSYTYVITIKHLTPYVIIHELAHMVEKELALDLNKEFMPLIINDLKALHNTNLLVKNLITQVILKEVNLYHRHDQASETFARFFELFAWTQEVFPADREYMVLITDIYKFFARTTDWAQNLLKDKINEKVTDKVKEYSANTPLLTQSKRNFENKWRNRIPEHSYRKINSNFSE